MRASGGPTLSLRHLLILLTAIGLLPLATLGVWNLHAASEYRQREQERSMLDLARALSSAVDAELDGTVATLSSMARSPTLAAGNIRGFYDIAVQQAHSQDEWLSVILADADGHMLFRTNAPYGAAPAPVADPASLQQVLALRRPVVGRIARGKGGTLAVPVRIPVSDGAGRLYALTAVVRPDRIVRVIERQRTPVGSVIGVIDASGALVARSRHKAIGERPSPSLVQLMQTGGPENVGRTTTLEGDDVVTAYTRLSHYGWTVAIGAPPAPLRAGFVSGFALYGAAIALSLAVCIALASWLAARIVRGIERLERGAAALGAGAPVAIAPSRIREMQRIGQALEATARQRNAHEDERSRLLVSLKEALERQEEALGEARSAGRAKDEFLAVLGHELRNPLSPIVASLDLMDMRDEPAGRRERTIMRRQVSHLKRLVDDLLDVSRIASGKLQVDLRPLDLAELARQTVAALPDQPIGLQAPAALWVDGDESRLAQVLNNLLSNAARFGSSATRVTLEAVDGSAHLRVEDNGVGMEADLLARVFEPFYQAPQPLARHTGGLGLGLAIVRRIVELHGGRVAARSAGPGRGSCFEVVLPLAEAPAAPAAPERAPDSRRLRVLLVDDNEDAAATGAALLGQLGHEVRTAYTAGQALAAAREFHPEVAILDIGLPDMDGYGLAAILRRTGTPGLRLVALTGYGQKTDVERARAAGFDLHLTKPAGLEDLQRALQTAAPA
ncbi:hybrid sensor histidine kinase/response regulator [Massilia sp. TN1-12]|uniref:hybrid sensor histidine kinase/response regulator n=1 Tax=Massilia paldalensis TaxID=3377675 RepID=UPI00384C6F86